MQTADAVVIGAGVIGASIAYHLARAALRVVVVERSTVAGEATGRSLAFIRVHYTNTPEATLALASQKVYAAWRETFGTPVYTRSGFARIVGPDDAANLEANVAALRRIGADTRTLSADEFAELQPGYSLTSGEIAAYEPDGGYADPATATSDYLDAARRLGTRLIVGTPVTQIGVGDGRITQVCAGDEPIATPIVVNAAGAWADRVAQLAGVEHGVRPMRMQVVAVERPSSVHTLLTCIDGPGGVSFRPEGDRLVFLSIDDSDSSTDLEQYQTRPDDAHVAEVAARIACRLPAMATAGYHSGFAAVEGASPDGHLLLGQCAEVAGFYFAVGFSGGGFKLAPAVGLGLAELIVDARCHTFDLEPFGSLASPRRHELRGRWEYGDLLWQ